MTNLSFRVSSGLKTIIGKELITDDFIAIFELVKNSFDAQAKNVHIFFKNIDDINAKIIIQDDGDGMDFDDIEKKWLFVAYSEKKEHEKDYRDKINNKSRIFAGAKGIGRFSCDRLGGGLKVYTKKNKKEPWNILKINWNDFEENPKKEFQNIPATHTLSKYVPYEADHGTILEISNLRTETGGLWNRDKLIKLRRSLERLINPNQENDVSKFDIYLHCEVEQAADDKLIEEAKNNAQEIPYWNIVNNKIRNLVFENIREKTVEIFINVSPDSSIITTELFDRGKSVYRIIQKNPYGKELHDIAIKLFAFDSIAKTSFTKYMGVRLRDYGSIFLYKNGFRIHPFGDPGDDKLRIDARHQQGVFRTLGSRDISGNISITGSNPYFQETSSRDGGLLENTAFENLRSLLINYGLKRLEKYFIDLTKYGMAKGTLPDQDTLPSDARSMLFDIISELSDAKNIIDFEYNEHIINILQSRSEKSISRLLSNLKKLAKERGNAKDDFLIESEISKAERQLSDLAQAKKEAEEAERKARKRAQLAEQEAKLERERANRALDEAKQAKLAAQEAIASKKNKETQNVFLKSLLSKDLEHLLHMCHGIGQDALTIEKMINNTFLLIRKHKITTIEEFYPILERMAFVAKRIDSKSKIATQANHISAQEEAHTDLIEYIREYLLNIYGGFVFDKNNQIPIEFIQNSFDSFVIHFAPINISMIFDNLLSNSIKHKITKIFVEVIKCDNESLRLRFSDNGTGILKKNIPEIFEFGFTTTNGSGLGLYHTKEILNKINGNIEIDSTYKNGASFLIEFKNNEKHS